MTVVPALRSSRVATVCVALLSFVTGCSSSPETARGEPAGSGAGLQGAASGGSTSGSGGGGNAGGGSGNGTGAQGGTGSGGMSGVGPGMTGAGAPDGSSTSTGPGPSDGAAAGVDASLDGGAAPAGEAGAPAMHADLGKGNGSDVVLLGDSWMSNTLQVEGTGGGIAPALQQVSAQPYRNYAVQGVMMLQADTFGPAIPTQWPQAVMANPNIKTVVMTGGGNDIIQNASLQTDCQQGGMMCAMVMEQIAQAFNTLWTQMADAGVQDVVYVMYAKNVGATAASLRPDGGLGPYPICTSGKIRCHTVDTTAAVNGQIAGDGIHPLAAANQRVAMQIYNLMVSEGMRR
ncbi:MAG TPA: SGNH/GDSL hydrolase family protein [Polyangiaceae bacterium]|nr:SGNH/GDSL hydrolase family protein [Polyangiaceae bacterium]